MAIGLDQPPERRQEESSSSTAFPALRRGLSHRSAAMLLLITLLAIFAGEAAVMGLLHLIPALAPIPEAFLDAALLTVLVFPAVYFAVFRPMLREIETRRRVQNELRTSRFLLTEAQRVAQFGHWQWHVTQDRMRWSDEALRILRLPRDHPPNRLDALLEVVHPDDRDHLQQVIDTAVMQGQSGSADCCILAPDGSHRMLHCQVEVFHGDHGERVTHLIGVIQDVTEAWQARRELEDAYASLDARVAERTRELAGANRALLQERTFSEAVVGTSGALIVVLDRDGRIVRFNAACERVTGYTAEEVVGRVFWSFLVPPEERAEVQKVLAQLTAGQFPNEHQNHWLARDGRSVYISWANTATLDDRGEVECVVATGLDMTERRQVELELQVSEERLRAVLQTAQDGFVMLDLDGRLIDVNDAYCEITGYPREELLGEHFTAFRAVGERTAGEDRLEEVVRRGRARFETRHRHKQGRPIDVEVSVSYLATGGGRLFAFLRDVTERNRAAAELERRRAELEAIFNAHTDAIVFSDQRRRIAFTNPAFTTMFGYSADEVRGRTTHFLDVEPRASGEPEPTADTDSDAHRRLQIACRRKNGSILWVEISGAPVCDGRGNLLGYVGVHRDVSEQRLAEATIRASLHEKEVLLQEIHHRVKNNLQVIASLLSLQADQGHDPAAEKPLLESQNRIRSLALVHEKLYRSRDLARLDVRDYVTDLVDSVLASVNHGRTRICLVTDIEEVGFDVDTVIPIALIVNELVSNCVKHAFVERERGTIRIALGRLRHDHFRLTVADDGVGLPHAFSIAGSRTLGLQLVEVLASQLDGAVRTGSGPGATFHIDFCQPTAAGAPP